jgi:hypothetical protein
MAERDSLTEESKWLIELLRLLWVTLLAIGGGTMGLILGERGLLRNIFTALGAIAIVTLVVGIYQIRKRAKVIIKTLRVRVNDGLFRLDYWDRRLCFYHRSRMDNAWDNLDPVGDMPCTKQTVCRAHPTLEVPPTTPWRLANLPCQTPR